MAEWKSRCDLVNMVEVVNGVDNLASMRAALGI